MSSLKNRYEIVAIVEARMCNPNGDPNMANRPRSDRETNIGIITDAAIKSRIRKYIQHAYGDVENCEILISDGTNLNKKIAESVINTSGLKEENEIKKQEEAGQYMCKKYWDVRTFGGVLSTGLNAGQVRGAVQVSMSCSVDPIETRVDTITRKCFVVSDQKFTNLEDYDKADEKMDSSAMRTMGTKAYTPFGLYVVKFSVSGNIAQKNGFSEEDLSKLMEGILQMYNIDASSSKMGMSVLSPLVVFKHVGVGTGNEIQNRNEALLGCAGSQRLFDLVKVKRKNDVDVPRSYEDYNITLDLSRLPKGVECGVKREFYDGVTWLNTNEKVDLMEF